MNRVLNIILILFFLFGTIVTVCYAVATEIRIPKDVSECSSQFGYTKTKEIKTIGGYRLVCHNPDTNMSYYYTKFSTSRGSIETYSFYLNGNACGSACDFNGNNCKSGICNVSSCNKKYGYTELELEKTNTNNKLFLCHKKGTKLSYRPVNSKIATNVFYYNGLKCGTDCDMNGRNCIYETGLYPMIGICNPTDCPQGYIIQQGYCKNPDTNELFYKDRDGKFKNDDIRSKKVDREMTKGRIQLYLKNVLK